MAVQTTSLPLLGQSLEVSEETAAAAAAAADGVEVKTGRGVPEF